MANENNEYTAYGYLDNLDFGKEIKIEHSVCLNNNVDLSSLSVLSIEELTELEDKSKELEAEEYNNMLEMIHKWEEIAAETQKIRVAKEYASTKKSKHTENEWIKEISYDRCHMEISNAVYKMSYIINEDTVYDRSLEKMIPESYRVSWDISTNSPLGGNRSLSSQFRKKYKDKESAEKYIAGRIKHYKNLFTEIYPPIPENLKSRFSIKGTLLPGYTICSPDDDSAGN